MIAADIFKALGDPVRLRLFHLLASRDELCVCHLTDALNLPQSTVSRHLGILRHAGLVATRREGKWMHYRLTSGVAGKLAALIPEFSADETFQKDGERLQQSSEGQS
ncbi:MAG: metalloregulator ArsR/SmtB family transcription factor [Mariprofundaceae bacterium]|nr:metalloregulator ArsR/SmtB family transcription factor [Mariprofundaceae bacterium]